MELEKARQFAQARAVITEAINNQPVDISAVRERRPMYEFNTLWERIVGMAESCGGEVEGSDGAEHTEVTAPDSESVVSVTLKAYHAPSRHQTGFMADRVIEAAWSDGQAMGDPERVTDAEMTAGAINTDSLGRLTSVGQSVSAASRILLGTTEAVVS